MIPLIVAIVHIVMMIIFLGLALLVTTATGSAMAFLVFTWLFQCLAFNANAFVLILRRSKFGGGNDLSGWGMIYMIIHTALEALFILTYWILIGETFGGAGPQGQAGAAIAFSVLTFVANVAVAVFYFTGLMSESS